MRSCPRRRSAGSLRPARWRAPTNCSAIHSRWSARYSTATSAAVSLDFRRRIWFRMSTNACRATASTRRLTNGVPSAVNVGVRPTFVTGRGLLVESFLIDWAGDLYDQEIEIAFLARLRGERRYDNVDLLIEQMERDVMQAREICLAALPQT